MMTVDITDASRGCKCTYVVHCNTRGHELSYVFHFGGRVGALSVEENRSLWSSGTHIDTYVRFTERRQEARASDFCTNRSYLWSQPGKAANCLNLRFINSRFVGVLPILTMKTSSQIAHSHRGRRALIMSTREWEKFYIRGTLLLP